MEQKEQQKKKDVRRVNNWISKVKFSL